MQAWHGLTLQENFPTDVKLEFIMPQPGDDATVFGKIILRQNRSSSRCSGAAPDAHINSIVTKRKCRVDGLYTPRDRLPACKRRCDCSRGASRRSAPRPQMTRP